MSTQVPNKFTSYQLTAEEEKAGFILTQNNIQVFQNELALTAEAKITLTFDPANPSVFLQQEAYLRGKLEFIEWLFAMHKQFSDEQLEDAKTIAVQQGNEFVSESPNTLIFGAS